MAYVSWASSDSVRRTMVGNRRRDTLPEMRVRRAAHSLGLRYYVDRQPLKGLRRRADLVFPDGRIAVFIDGCYWHGCPTHRVPPRTNASYWSGKVERNRARDVDTEHRLADAGWLTLRFWEHDDPVKAAAQIYEAVMTKRDEAQLSPPVPLRPPATVVA